MLNSRSKHQEIEFLYLGNSTNMPTGRSIKDGDDVILKYNQNDIEVDSLTKIAEDSFIGTVSSILNLDSEEVLEIGEPLNIKVGETIRFSDSNIFNCTKNS